MGKPIIQRYFSDEEVFSNVKKAFKFLCDKINDTGFEYDLQIRQNYFNVYHKGNSLGKVSYNKKTKEYNISIHEKFTENIRGIERFEHKRRNKYMLFTLRKNEVNAFFSKKNLFSMGQNVKKVYSQEETTFEQMLMTDNIGRKELIIIDRQVQDKSARTKIDLLTLKQADGNNYQFCVLEVKLGNNPELQDKVSDQLRGYIQRIESKFDDYKKCYEINFKQKKDLGLINPTFEVNIVRPVIGAVIVVAYLGLADKSIAKLKEKDPSIKVLRLPHNINL